MANILAMRKKTPSRKQPIHNTIIRHLREWHRKLGITSALFLIFLSLSGIALNHTKTLSLGKSLINSQWMHDHYGIKAPEDIRYFENKKLSITNNYVWLENKLLTETNEPIISAAKFEKFWLILTSTQLVIFNSAGNLVDKLDTTLGLPENINKLGFSKQNIVVETPNGLYISDENLIDWQAFTQNDNITWFQQDEITANEINKASQRYRSQFLTLERIILDAHSGRIFGDIGVFIVDIIGFIIILLSISGIYIWLRYANSKR